MCLPLGVSAWGTVCVHVCVFVFVFVVCARQYVGKREIIFSAVILCEHKRKVSLNTQITARADKSAFRVGSNP